ncbi:MAG: undecaprenyl-diphosphate phosphatase [Chitinispirillales bacterium]|jgi:undecaprenyl-diphosphatase|nr:undecaprenyl-diphosphate phosphatase [Chitinispirillales bacterium]
MDNFSALLKAGILGIIEGITEFLPISSTGHLIIAEKFIQLSQNSSFVASFEVIIQLGAVLSIVVLFWNKLFPFKQGAQHYEKTLNLWFLVIIGVIPAAVIGFLLDDFIEEKLFTPLVVAGALVFYGIILIFIEKTNKMQIKITDVSEIPVIFAVAIGFFQCLAMVPGTSRSAATIIGGLLLGLSRVAAAQFSFFLAIPTMCGASLLKILKNGLSFSSFEITLIAVGFVVSFISAFAVVKFLMNYISKNNFVIFGYYRIFLGVIIGILSLFFSF